MNMNKEIHAAAIEEAAKTLGMNVNDFMLELENRMLADPTVPESIKQDILKHLEKN